MYAPIALFVYNRPLHTKNTVESILTNEYSKDTVLYIFSDHEKINATTAERINVKTVKNYIKSIHGFKEIHIVERTSNYGLSKNITTGVSEVIDKHERIIVLEDDMVCSKGFLQYMNEALDFYNNEEMVGCIHGWNYPLDTRKAINDTFFLLGADCWGWATWKRAWKFYNPNGTYLLDYIQNNNLSYNFNRRDTIDFVKMLKDQILNKNDSWAVRWHASLFIRNMYCLHPVKSMIINIGFDSSGVHNGSFFINQVINDSTRLKKISLVESEWFYSEFEGKTHNYFFYSPKKNLFVRGINYLRRKFY